MPDEIVADVGIERAEIPAVAAALADGRPVAAVAGEAAEVEPGVPAPAQLSASVLAFIEVRSSAQRAANQHIDRPAAYARPTVGPKARSAPNQATGWTRRQERRCPAAHRGGRRGTVGLCTSVR